MTQHLDSDSDVVRRLLRGDEAAFSTFFDRMFPRVYRFALARLGQREHAAEDVAQATLCQAIRKLETWRGEASLFTWICTICRHEIGAWRRANDDTAAVELLEDSPEVRAALESAGVHAGVEGLFERRELATLVQRLLDYLPSHYGDALEWKYLEDRSVREIAERLDISEKAAESLLTRARAAFRDLVASVAPELGPRGSEGGLS